VRPRRFRTRLARRERPMVAGGALLEEYVVGRNRAPVNIRRCASRSGLRWRHLLLSTVVVTATLAATGLTMSAHAQLLPTQIPAEIAHNWGWFLIFGIALAALGVAAIARSVTATVVSMLYFGWLLLIAAGIEIVQTIMVGQWAGMFQHLVAAVLFGVVGFLIILRPVVTAEILTLLMGAFFLASGLFQIVAPAFISLPDWGWHVLSGIITLLLGILVLAQWPVSGLWVIGMFVGIELLFYGIAWIAIALHLRGK
jgi:uncharacterized membrane protein HdeD (DUF308 family)